MTDSQQQSPLASHNRSVRIMLLVAGGVFIVSGALGLLALYATPADGDRGYSGLTSKRVEQFADVARDPWLSASSWLFTSSTVYVAMGVSIASFACIPNILIRAPIRVCMHCKHCLIPQQTVCPECGRTSPQRVP